MTAPNDLIASAQSGSPQALSTLLARAQPDIRRYAQASCRAADIDDAVQDAMCLLHRHIGSLRVLSAFSSWLFQVVKRECIRLARRARGSFAPVDVIEDDLKFSSRPEHELRLDLGAAIGSLPEHYRQIVVLRDIEERTIAEIADTLGVTCEAVKARLHRARALVREYLER